MSEVTRLIGVFHGDGGVRGEIVYFLGKLRGTTHCALCDITHRGVVANKEWKQLSCQIAVPFDFVHRNERTPEVEAASGDATPTVLAEADGELLVLLSPAELEPLNGDAAAFLAALTAKAAALSLSIPGLEEQPL